MPCKPSASGNITTAPAVTSSEISPARLYRLMQHQCFGTEYQPIVELKTGDTLAWEALARFYDDNDTPIRPDWVFEALHRDELSLFQVEYRMKALQLSLAPPQAALFLNLDPHAFALFGARTDNPLLQLLQQDTRNVIEIIENTDAGDAVCSRQMADAFRSCGLKTALDDLGAPNSMLSFDVLLSVDYLKLDRSWLQHRPDSAQGQLLDTLCSYARNSGKALVLEGIETEQDLAFARRLNVDYVQGFYYRNRFIQRRA